MTTNWSSPDLSKHAPRSPYAKLGGYVHLPRLLDKARAEAAGKIGEYKYNCPADQRFFTFVGIDPVAFLTAAKTGKSDWEMFLWVEQNAKNKRGDWEKLQWCQFVTQNSPGDYETMEWFAGAIKKYGPNREDIRTFSDLLELDDYVSFGGKA